MYYCLFCQSRVPNASAGGVQNRNHCPFCLWSKHVDIDAGDRKARCQSGMEPIGLTFKMEKPNKYNPNQNGELMIIHRCLLCHKISINRIASDDDTEKILDLLNKKLDQKQIKDLLDFGITSLSIKDREKVRRQLFGR